MFLKVKLVTLPPPNNACSGLGGTRREKTAVAAKAFFRFDAWSSHQATNASR
jgi:hypothetical protein